MSGHGHGVQMQGMRAEHSHVAWMQGIMQRVTTMHDHRAWMQGKKPCCVVTVHACSAHLQRRHGCDARTQGTAVIQGCTTPWWCKPSGFPNSC